MVAPKVSVVVRSIGRATLESALASIAGQQYPSLEVVLVAATGDAHPLIRNACGPHPIRAVRSQAKLSRADAADVGIRAATGDWITFLDDDDEMLPGHVAGLVGSTATMREVRAVTGRALATFRDGRTELWGQRFALAELYQRNFVHLSTLLFHRSLLNAGIAFDHGLPIHEDWDFALQVAQHTHFADWPCATFRWNADAGTSGAGGGTNVDDAFFAKYRDYVYAKWAIHHDQLSERCAGLLGRAAAAAAAGRLDEACIFAQDVLVFSQNDPYALNLLAMVSIRQGNNPQAIEQQALAVEVRPYDADLRYNLANALLVAGNIKGARNALADTLKLDPTHARAHQKMGQLGAPATSPNAPGKFPSR